MTKNKSCPYTLIAQKQHPSVSSLMEHFGISKRSVFRYLEIINFIDPIEFDHERNGYKFTNGDRIKKLTLNDSELLILLAAGEAVSHLGEPLGENFRTLVSRMTVTSMLSTLRRSHETIPLRDSGSGLTGCDVLSHSRSKINRQRSSWLLSAL